MKTLEKPKGEDYFYGWNYDQVIDSMEYERLHEKSFGSYQGDTLVLLRDGTRYGVLEYGWGSCSGCDRLEAIGTDEKGVNEFRDRLAESIKWFDTAAECSDYLQSHDWEGSFWGAEVDEVRSKFVLPAVAILTKG